VGGALDGWISRLGDGLFDLAAEPGVVFLGVGTAGSRGLFHKRGVSPAARSADPWEVRGSRERKEPPVRPAIRWQAEHLDWGPLETVVGSEHLSEWMWMHTVASPETGADVHFYKHISSRRYVRLDHHARVYAETADGEPRLLPPCGGGTLLLVLLGVCAHVDPGVPQTITLPDAARRVSRTEDYDVLETLFDSTAQEYERMRHPLVAPRSDDEEPGPPLTLPTRVDVSYKTSYAALMGEMISVRLDGDAKRALAELEATGMSRSEAVRAGLVAAARRLRDRQALAAEAATLAEDEADRAEAQQIAEMMEELRAPW
jgi:Arc/MetJ-type ribon-helix-helix transcriptional regulator